MQQEKIGTFFQRQQEQEQLQPSKQNKDSVLKQEVRKTRTLVADFLLDFGI
jgi:hypothetical protein